MSDRYLIVVRDGKETQIPMEQEKLFVGRDKKCEVVLDDESISRKHAAIIFRYGVVYVENISPTGQILKDGKPIEVCELAEGHSIQIGPFELKWQAGAVAESAPPDEAQSPLGPPEELESFEVGNAQEPAFESVTQGQGGQPPEQQGAAEAFDIAPPAPEAFELGNKFDGAPSIEGMDQSPGDTNANLPVQAGRTDLVGMNTSDIPVVTGSSGETKITSSPLQAILKISKGEQIGREIKLNDGSSWTVGRGSKNEVQIDNAKLSRAHFKIVRVGPSYRLQDLGSANGTKVNGVTVQDAPLSSFDVIQAGPLELQFLISDSKNAPGLAPQGALAAPMMAGLAFEDAEANQAPFAAQQEKTVFSPPVPASPPRAGFFEGGPRVMTRLDLTQGRGSPFAGAPNAAPASPDAQGAKQPGKLAAWWMSKPKKTRIIYAIAALLIAAVIGSSYLPQQAPTTPVALAPTASDPSQQTPPLATNPAAANPASATPAGAAKTASDTTKDNAADPSVVAPEFEKLTPTQQKEAQELYAKAERARAAKDWNTAFESAKALTKMVDKYKNIQEILFEAQNELNEAAIGGINTTQANVADAAAGNKELLATYLEAGEKALKEKRWDDAQEAYSKALTLDPTNDKATQGFVRAQAKNPNATVVAPNAVQGPSDEELAAAQQLKDEIAALKLKFSDARSKINNGGFGQALGTLKELEQELKGTINDIGAGVERAPASIQDKAMVDAQSLQVKVREAIDTSRAQLMSEYQTQMADAEEFINNRQYVQAREIYDRIIRMEPAFDDAHQARERLYGKILAEAKNLYQEALIYESVGDLDLAIEGFSKSRDLLLNVEHSQATEYYKRSVQKLKRLAR